MVFPVPVTSHLVFSLASSCLSCRSILPLEGLVGAVGLSTSTTSGHSICLVLGGEGLRWRENITTPLLGDEVAGIML